MEMGKDWVILSLTWKEVLGPFPGPEEALPEGAESVSREGYGLRRWLRGKAERPLAGPLGHRGECC